MKAAPVACSRCSRCATRTPCQVVLELRVLAAQLPDHAPRWADIVDLLLPVTGARPSWECARAKGELASARVLKQWEEDNGREHRVLITEQAQNELSDNEAQESEERVCGPRDADSTARIRHATLAEPRGLVLRTTGEEPPGRGATREPPRAC